MLQWSIDVLTTMQAIISDTDTYSLTVVGSTKQNKILIFVLQTYRMRYNYNWCNCLWHWTSRFCHQYTGIIWVMIWCNCLWQLTFRFCHQYTGIIWVMIWCNCLWHWTFRFCHQYTGIIWVMIWCNCLWQLTQILSPIYRYYMGNDLM